MLRFTFISALLAASVLAIPSPLTPDPAGEKNIGNGRGGQFIGGACLSSADCASTCCATLSGAGICSGLGAQFQAGKQGCGFGDGGAVAPPPAQGTAAPANPAAGVAVGIDQNAPGSQNVGTGNGQQFITGQCFSDADCASGCCAGPKGACSAVAVANENGKTGCGFRTAGAPAAVDPVVQAPATADPPLVVVAAPAPGSAAVDLNAPGSQNVGTGNGQQFITGQCFTDADCASGCCAGPKGACSAVAVANENGKTGCGFGGNGAVATPPVAQQPPANTGSGVVDLNAPGSQNVGTGNGQQFITGQCFANADCASGCCAGPKGACSAVAVANENGKTGCGFTVTRR